MKKTLSLLLLLALCGCTTTTLTKGDLKFKRTAVGNKAAIGELTSSSSTNGLFKIGLKQYSTDTVQGLQIVTDALLQALIEGAKKGATGGVAP